MVTKKYPSIVIKRNADFEDEGTPNYIPKETQRIYSWLGCYHRGLETEDFVYFVNYQEGDESACVIMFRKNSEKEGTLELASANYFAYNDMFELITEREHEITFVSPAMKNNIRLHKEAMKENVE